MSRSNATTTAEEVSSSSSSCSALPPYEDPPVYLYGDNDQPISRRASSLQAPASNDSNIHHQPRRWSEGCAPPNIAEFATPKRHSLKSDPRSKSEDKKKKRGSSLKSRSKSLQHNGRAASYYHTRVASPYYTDHNPDGGSPADALSESHPELITLDNMPKELGLLSRDKKSSISFSAVSFMVDTMQKLHSRITDKKVDIEKAVMEEDVDSLRTLCQQDVAAVSVAAFAAAKEDMEGVLEEVLYLCEGEIDPKRLVDEVGGNDGGGLLHAAAGAGAEKTAKVLLDKGFDPNGWNRAATATPVHEAAAAGAIDLLKTLADTSGGDLNAGKDSNDDDRPSVLQAAVAANRTEVVSFLLERKVAKMKRGKFTETALHTACRHNRAECAQLLLEDGVLVDAQGGGPGKRETALHLAAGNGYTETMEVLLAHSADPNARNARGETPLHQAAATLSLSAMRALLDAGADVDARDASGRPPIHFAVNSMQKGARECLQLLLDRGADIDLGDENGYTALHLAALSRRLTRVRLLIAAGADLCMRNNAGKSALHFVMKYVPNSLRTIEERMDGGLQLDTSGGDKVTAGMGGGGGCGTVKMNFNLLIPSRGNRGALSEVGLFTEILQMHNNDPARLEKILMHPLSLSFLHLKWQQMKWLYYIMILFSHFVYSVTYSIYTVLIFGYLCKPDVDEYPISRPRLSEPIPCDLAGSPATRGLAMTAWIFLIIFNIIYTLKEMTKMLHLRGRYFLEWESCLNLVTIASFPLITFHQNPFSSTQEVSFRAWQFHAAGVGVLVTWILQMFLIGKVPRFGKYVQMLINVGWSFFSFFVAYFALILGFSLAFVILFPREVSFTEALTAPIKVMVMMTGEIEYNDLYYPQKEYLTIKPNASSPYDAVLEELDVQQLFPFTAHLVLTVFILIVAIVIMNLLFGMAVSDVQELYKMSRLHQSIQQVHLIAYMEGLMRAPMFRHLPRCVRDFFRRRLLGLEGRYRNVCEVEPDSYDDKKLLPHHLNKTIKQKCHDIQQKREDQNNPTIRSLTSQVGRLERQVEALTGAISRLLEENGAGGIGGGGKDSDRSKVGLSSSAYTMSTDDMDGSLSSDGGRKEGSNSNDDDDDEMEEEATTEEIDDDDGLNLEMQQQAVTSTPTTPSSGGNVRPQFVPKRPSQLSVLDQIREEE